LPDDVEVVVNALHKKTRGFLPTVLTEAFGHPDICWESLKTLGRQCWSFLEGVDNEFLAAKGNALFDHNDGRSLSLCDHEMTEFRIWEVWEA